MASRSFLKSSGKALVFLFISSPFSVVLSADYLRGVRLLTDIRYDQSNNHDALSTKERSLIGFYDSRIFTADAINIPAELIVELPDQSITKFSKTSFQMVGPVDETSGNFFRVWNGDIKGDHDSLSSGKASVVVSPSGNLFCNIKIGGKNFECKRCEQDSDSEQNQKSCVKVKEAVRNENEMPRKLIKKVSSEYLNRENWQIDEELSALHRIVPNSVAGMQNLEDIGTLDDSYLLDSSVNVEETRNYIDDGTVVDIAIFHTTAAVDYFGSEEELQAGVGILISRQNEIFSNTNIELEIRVVFWGATEFSEEDNNGDSLTYIETDPTIQLTRQMFGADIVIMLIIGDDSSAYYVNPPSRETDTRGHAALAVELITFDDTVLPAVLGIQFGCAFEYEYETQLQVIPYAYGYQSVNCDFHTLMSDPCSISSVQLDAYSSPLHTWRTTGEPIGNAESADCSRAISETKIFVAQYRDSVDFFSSSPTHSPTSAPTDVHNSCIGDCFSILIESILVDQGTWDKALMGDIFIAAVQDVTRIIPDAEKSIVVIESGKLGNYIVTDSVYGEFQYPATKITYTVEHINAEAATYDVFDAVFNASENGELSQTLLDSTFYYTVSFIITEQVGDAEVGTATFVPSE